MAEGWAQKWIQSEKESLCKSIGKRNLQAKNTKSDAMAHRLSMLQNTVVASVALDSGAVFITTDNAKDGYNDCQVNQLKDDRSNRNGATLYNPKPQRKQIKSKAVDAMAKDGVDISSFVPKTVDELIPLIVYQRNTTNGYHSLEINSEQQKYHGHMMCRYPQDFSFTRKTKENDIIDNLDDYGNRSSKNIYEDGHQTSNDEKIDNEAEEKEREDIILDKLIVLCSCGDDLMYNLIQRSRSVEQWSIDAPTVAAKAGEGDEAYRRVSLQIREKVNTLMNTLFGETKFLIE